VRRKTDFCVNEDTQKASRAPFVMSPYN